MDMFIKTPEAGEILLEEFMKPLNISSYKLAHSICVPVSRIQDILHNRRKITADTSLRLSKFFGVSERYFLDIQNDIDLRKLKLEYGKELDAIQPYRAG
jgi:addiction module HigA family antidote